MAYSPYLPRTPQSARTRMSSSAPSTPRIGCTSDRPRHAAHHCTGILMQHDSNSDGSVGCVSSAHRSTCTSYGTMQTDLGHGCAVSKPKLQIVMDTSTPSDDGSIRSVTVLRKSTAWVWAIGNMTIFGFVVFSLLQPYWIRNGLTGACLGLLNYCEKGINPNTEWENCRYYHTNTTASLLTISSISWKVGVVLYLMSCVLLGMSALLASLCLCVPNTSVINRISLISGFQQLTAGILLLTSMVIFPVGLDAVEVRYTCGPRSDVYALGDCGIGWSYILSAACSVLCLILPALSHHITHIPKYNILLK